MSKNQKLSLAKTTTATLVFTRNACKLCAPLGASIVFRGIEGCVPLVHGSQGCSTYIRRYIISHFKEPIDIASSNFSEESAIFGGGVNLKKALDNIKRQYEPAAIGIATTCLSETIGDDVGLYLEQYRQDKLAETMPVIVHASTPSYSGTHMEGYQAAVLATIQALAEGGAPRDTVNIVTGFLSPEDLRHLKNILLDFGIDYTLFPDYSETLDGESWSTYQKLSAGGTPLASLRGMGRARATVQLGGNLSRTETAAGYLESKYGVPAVKLGLPIGIRETDKLFQALEQLTGKPTPEKYQQERGRLVDAYIDGHKYLFGKRAIIYGEMDFVAATASFLDEIGIVPVLCATGAYTGHFREAICTLVENNHQAMQVVEDTDFATMLELCRIEGADIVIGNSKGYQLAKKLDIPLVRAGFPIHDRLGGQRLLHAGYRGTQQLFDRIVNALIEQQQESSPVGYSYM